MSGFDRTLSEIYSLFIKHFSCRQRLTCPLKGWTCSTNTSSWASTRGTPPPRRAHLGGASCPRQPPNRWKTGYSNTLGWVELLTNISTLYTLTDISTLYTLTDISTLYNVHIVYIRTLYTYILLHASFYLIRYYIVLYYIETNFKSIDNSFLSSHKNISPIGQKMAELWPKNVCPYME